MTATIQLRKAKLRNITKNYEIYLNSLSKENRPWTNILLETPKKPSKLNFERALSIHLLNIFYARLSAVARTGSISALFQPIWNPLLFEVISQSKFIGCVFISRQSETVFQINVLTTTKIEEREEIECNVLILLKTFLKSLGAKRIVIKAIKEDTKKQLELSGFKVAFLDNVLQLDLENKTDNSITF